MLSILLLTFIAIFIAFLFAAVIFKLCLRLAVYFGPLLLSLYSYNHDNLFAATMWLFAQFAIWAYLVDNENHHPPLA